MQESFCTLQTFSLTMTGLDFLLHRAAALELRLVALALSLGLRRASQELQQSWIALLGRVLRRQHLGVHAALVRCRARAPHAALSPDESEEAAEVMAGARADFANQPVRGRP